MLLTLLSSLTIGSNCYAEEIKAVYLTQNSIAPFSGYLLSPSQAQLIATELQDYDKVKLINKSLQTSLDLLQSNETVYKTEIEQLSTQNDSLSRTLVQEKDKNHIDQIIYFTLGILTTGLIVYVSHQ